MVIQPKVRGFMCTTAHPVGCAAITRRQIEHVKSHGEITGGPRNALIVGASTGYGLASRVCAAFGSRAKTLGVFFEKPADGKRTASPGWYNAAALAEQAQSDGLYAASLNGDAFSDELKAQAVDILRRDMGPLDLLVYSLAAPRRLHPSSGKVYSSALKPIGGAITERNLNTDRREVGEVTIEAASEEEIAGTVAVMGGEDWEMWIAELDKADLLADGFKTVAYTYIGDKITWPIYGQATIGAAKQDLDRAAAMLRGVLKGRGDARVAGLKAVVTQASSAIPIMPLYLSLLFKEMKARGVHQGCIEQINGLFRERIYASSQAPMDESGRWRMDAAELDGVIQRAIEKQWDKVSTDNLDETTDFVGYQHEFMQLFGFEVEGVDYAADVDPNIAIPGLIEQSS